jgi:hypothetical protein
LSIQLVSPSKLFNNKLQSSAYFYGEYCMCELQNMLTTSRGVQDCFHCIERRVSLRRALLFMYISTAFTTKNLQYSFRTKFTKASSGPLPKYCNNIQGSIGIVIFIQINLAPLVSNLVKEYLTNGIEIPL